MYARIILLASLWPALASAQWAMLDRQAEGAYAQTQLDFVVPIETADRFFLRTELYGQLDFGDWGTYLAFPFTTVYPDSEFERNETVAGNLEVGGFYQLGVDDLDLMFRLGLVVGAASQDPGRVIIGAVGASARPSDLILQVPVQWGLRFGISPIYSSGLLLAKADIGVDLAFHERFESEPVTLFRGNVAAGVQTEYVSVLGEFTSAVAIGNGGLDGGSIYAAGLTIWFDTGFLEPYISAATPLQEDLLGRGMTVTVGLLLGEHGPSENRVRPQAERW